MLYELTGSPTDTKLDKHDGMYTRSYQVSRAKFDAKIRSWTIEFKDQLFWVIDSDGKTEAVYYEPRVFNCSCKFFVENQSGTCMHIEAVKLLAYNGNFNFSYLRPLLFVNAYEQTIKCVGGETNAYETPTVKSFQYYNEVKKLFRTGIDVLKENTNVFIDYGICLFDFQQESIQKMLKNQKTVLCLDMGLGKTLCALACCKILNKDRILIVAPNSLKYQWKAEIERFDLGSSIIIEKGLDINDYKDQRFVIISYEMLNHNQDFIKNNKFNILIADEIQKIKNEDSKSWESASKIKADYIFALSGTPIQNSITDLISLINFLNPDEMKPDWKFYEEFCYCSRARILGIKDERAEDLRNRFDPYIVNPKIDKSLLNLPKKNELHVRSKLSIDQTIIHDQYFDMAYKLIAKSMNTPLTFPERQMLNGMLTKARMASTDIRLFELEGANFNVKSEKFEMIEKKIKEISDAGNKVVVYSEWIKTLDLLVPFLDEKKISYIKFNGKLTGKKRDKELTKFLKDKMVSVMLSTDTGGLGVDGIQLVCSNVIHVEKLWNPMKIEQRNGRVIRTLQPEPTVNIFNFTTDAGIENMIASNHNRKYDVIHEMLSK